MKWPANTPDWLKEAETKDAKFRIEIRFGSPWVIWEGGIWIKGEFLGGEFRGGYFLGGEFLGGEFLGGYFQGGEFRGGYFLGGEFLGGEFLGGYFRGGEFLGGWWHGGIAVGGYLTIRSKYIPVASVDGKIKIGCKEKTIEEWDAWFAGTEEHQTSRGTPEFKMIYAHYRAIREYQITMEKK